MSQKNKCHACGRNDVRLYRSYGDFLRDEDIICNAHLPQRAGVPQTDWMVPLVEAPDGSVWGYTSCPDADIARWAALPDAVESPVWALSGGRWTPFVPDLEPTS